MPRSGKNFMSDSKPLNKERYFEILSRAAVQRFGEEKARSLDPLLRGMAQDLETLARQDLAPEEEPAFSQ